MKKVVLLAVGLLLIIAAGGAGSFYFRNLRGATTAFKKPSANIAELIQEEQERTDLEIKIPSEPPTDFYNPEPLQESIVKGPLVLPDGFRISVFAKDLVKPRVMIFDPSGVMLVSVPAEGKVVALPDKNTDGISDNTLNVLSGLNKPHGLAFRKFQRCTLGIPEECADFYELYVAETNMLSVYEYDPNRMMASNKRELITLPTDGYNQHHSRTILFNKENPNELLISVGSSCNICNEKDERRAKILVVDVVNNSTEYAEYARGLRNAVFMTHHPKTQDLWATEMGRDLLGDDIPPDEINVIERGANYGWPICYGNNVLDTDFHKDDHVHIRPDCSEPFEMPSTIDLQAHSAPLGLAFVPDDGYWPKELENDLLVAYHGSWNRTVPTGYKLVRHKFDKGGNYLGVEDFITGWLKSDETSLGRPVDILFEQNSMFISDDKAGVIYRVTYSGSR
jgi:glucose/arabinose dehydrogenase